MVLGSCTSAAVGCYLVFGGDILVAAAQVGPYLLTVLCCDMCFC
jgi:hypothetical protein